MRKSLLALMLLWSITVLAQIPSYYNDVNLTLTGMALKNELANKIIVTHTTDLRYSPNTWNAIRQTDADPNNPSNVVLIYGWNNSDSDITNDRTRDNTLQDTGSGEAFVWNREHVFSKSLASPVLVTSSAGAGTDVHNLRAADRSRNTSRSNRRFANGSGTASYITAEGYWYPGDEWKGDVARMMMYMYLRYGNQTLPTAVGVGTPVASDNNMIMLFLQWNAEDPVSSLEMQRNPVLEGLQGNRNPFIDNPAFATQIWGGPQAQDLFGPTGPPDTEAPTAPTNLSASNTTSFSTTLNWTASTDNIAVSSYDVYNGSTIVGSSSTTTYNVTGLSPSTNYTFSVRAKDAAGNQSTASNSVYVITQASSGGTATELFISEYIEGSSNNKALEIANFTGSPVDLSAYDLRKATNGSGSFGSTYQLTGTLANGTVFVIANSSAVAAITSVANVTTGSGIVTFNGNDAIALYKNGTMIDLLGNPSSSANFAQNTTLRRKSSITSPNTTYTTAEWDSFATDTFGGLGSHSVDGGSQGDTQAPTAPTSLAASNISETSLNLSWNASTDNVAVTGYDVYRGTVLIGSASTTAFNVTGLTVATSYSFTVRAKDAAGNVSGNSNTANATTVDVTAPSNPTSLASSNITETSVNLTWSASSDNAGVTGYDVYQGGSLLTSTTGTTYSVTGLTANTSYSFTVRAKDAAGNTSGDSNTLNVTTNDSLPSGTASDLLISEYVEGSSNNKALEIANFTGSPVDLSAYDLRKATNGSGSFGSTYQLTGTLANGSVFVIANSNAVAAITNVADVTTGSGIVTFNGNDAIALFKNNVLIDVMGVASSSNVFAANTTLRRKSSVTSPNTTYTTAEWDSFATDTFNGLGSHTLNGSADTQAPTAPTALTASTITETTANLSWSASTDNVGVTGYDVYQDASLVGSTTGTTYNVTGLTASTSYTFTVRAKDAAGNTSGDSNSENITTSSPPTSGPTILSESYFETGWDGWIDGGGDAARYSGSRSPEGSFSIRLRDNSGVASSMTSPSYDISSFNTVEVQFSFYVYSMENGEDFWLRYFDGSSWQTVETWVRGSGIENNNFYSETVILDATAYNFVSNAQFRFQNDASGNADHIYIDEVIITGNNNGGNRNASGNNLTLLRNYQSQPDLFSVYPNPVQGNILKVQLHNENEDFVNYRILSVLGRVLQKGAINNAQIDVESLKSGIYLLEIQMGDERLMKKFIKK